MAELQMWIASCSLCNGDKVVDNPEWGKFIASLSAEQLAAGVKSQSVKPRITCPSCHGLGRKVSSGVEQIFELYPDWQKVQQEQKQ
jgi:hypothetical protein